MKHHFGDFLDRDGNYWTIVPNRERYAYAIKDVPAHSKEISIVTISKEDENWETIFTLPNLVEVTFHEPSKEQLQSISKLTLIKRLRITHARPKDLEFIRMLANIEELVLEYVSGFSDLSPLQSLTNLRSLHMENLRRVNDFGGLKGIKSLQYLRIDGTLDWKQPISNFEFLSKLPNLEVLSFGQVINKTPYPALISVLNLKKLRKIRIGSNMLAAEEYALMEVALPDVKGANWGPYNRFGYGLIPLPTDDFRTHLSDELIKSNHPEVHISYTGERSLNDPKEEWFEFTGKKAGRVKCLNKNSKEKCEAYLQQYNIMKEEAKKVISMMGN